MTSVQVLLSGVHKSRASDRPGFFFILFVLFILMFYLFYIAVASNTCGSQCGTCL